MHTGNITAFNFCTLSNSNFRNNFFRLAAHASRPGMTSASEPFSKRHFRFCFLFFYSMSFKQGMLYFRAFGLRYLNKAPLVFTCSYSKWAPSTRSSQQHHQTLPQAELSNCSFKGTKGQKYASKTSRDLLPLICRHENVMEIAAVDKRWSTSQSRTFGWFEQQQQWWASQEILLCLAQCGFSDEKPTISADQCE